MTPFAWLLGLFLPACATSGAQGLPAPPMDLTHIVRPATPNTALAAPAGFMPTPDLTTPLYPVPAETLFAAVQAVAATESRTFPAAIYPDRLQAHYVARSALLNFPDLIAAQITADGADSSRLVLYSRSVYGRSDLGVNRKRLQTWLAALASRLTPARER